MIAIVIVLGFWALRLMEQAYEQQEFSRMLAGVLVVVAAGGVLTTYFLMSDYFSFVRQGSLLQQTAETPPVQVSWAEDGDYWRVTSPFP
ncbi:MAG: hypothetical protein NW237_14220 [Cyanobacteriota bacterium]|nr:hypothetical protein [Cyanobacteriota bacterium]